MQQTTNYKLNLIETSDPFSPKPLNENAETAEAQFTALHSLVAATDGRHCIDKLLTASAPEGASQFAMELSGIDLSQYGALVLVYGGEDGKQVMHMNINDSAEALPLMIDTSSSSIYSRYTGCGLGLLAPVGGRTYGVCLSGGSFAGQRSGTTCGILSTPWLEMTSFKFSPVGDSAFVVLFGLRF